MVRYLGFFCFSCRLGSASDAQRGIRLLHMLMGWGGQGDGNQQVGALLGSLEMLNPVFQASTCGLFASDVTVLEISACGFLAAFFSRPSAAIFFSQKPARRWLGISGFLRGSAGKKNPPKSGLAGVGPSRRAGFWQDSWRVFWCKPQRPQQALLGKPSTRCLVRQAHLRYLASIAGSGVG